MLAATAMQRSMEAGRRPAPHARWMHHRAYALLAIGLVVALSNAVVAAEQHAVSRQLVAPTRTVLPARERRRHIINENTPPLVLTRVDDTGVGARDVRFEITREPNKLPPILLARRSTVTVWTIDLDRAAVAELTAPTANATGGGDVQVDFQDEAAVWNVSINAIVPAPTITLVLDENSLAGMVNMKTFSVSGLNVSFDSRWLPNTAELDLISFTNCWLSIKFKFQKDTKIDTLILRNVTLPHFPTGILDRQSKGPSQLIMESCTFENPVSLNSTQMERVIQMESFKDNSAPPPTLCEEPSHKQDIGGVTICVKGSVSSTSSGSQASNRPVASSAQPAKNSSLAIYAAIGGLALVAVVLTLLLLSRRRKTSFVEHTQLTFTNPKASFVDTATTEIVLLHEYHGALCEFDLGKNNVKTESVLGVNGLWMADYLGDPVVALRMTAPMLARIEDGLDGVVKQFSLFRHANLTTFIGIAPAGAGDHLVVSEYMARGSLRALLTATEMNLSWSQRISMCLQIASAVAFLHTLQPSSVTIRLTSKSMLCDEDMTCKLNSHAFATILRRHRVPAAHYGQGEIAYRAPEILRGEPETQAAEIFALGVIYCELARGALLYRHVIDEYGLTRGEIHIAKEVAADRLRPPELTPSAPSELGAMIKACTAFHPQDRPSIDDVVRFFRALETQQQ